MTNGQKQTKLIAFTKPFTNKLKDAASIKGNAVMFMRKDVYDHIVDANKKVINWHEDARAKVTITVTSERSKDQ
jgi:hypothetical protein